MGKISRFFAACSTWKTGRWYLLFSVLTLLFVTFSPELILRYIVSPRADFNRNGWWMHFYEPSHPLDIKGYEVFLPSGEYIALNPDFIQARGYLLWNVPIDGQYCFNLIAKDDATLAVDGKKIIALEGNHLSVHRADQWVHLTKGRHLFQIQIENDSGDGVFSIGMTIPPLMNSRSLAGDDVAVPALWNLDTWAQILEILNTGKAIPWFLSAFFSLCLLLPLTLQNRTTSILITVGITLIPALFIPVNVRREPYIGEIVHQELREKRPDFVFIGNSMLWSRIDDAYLGQLLGGKKVHSIVNFGGLSAVHYLSFKYLFLPANINPKKVFIFFRRNQFTLPRARTTDPLVTKTIQRLTPAPDPVFEQIVHGRTRTVTDIVYDSLLKIFPVATAQEVVREKLNILAQIIASAGQQNGKHNNQEQQNILNLVNKRFSFANGSLRTDITAESLQEEKVKNPYDFYGRVENSFLPHILELAQKNNISLVFVRVQERPSEKGALQNPPELQKYMVDLRKYITAHGAELYDFTGDPELPLSAYHDGDHIEDQKKYTELFYRRLGDILQ